MSDEDEARYKRENAGESVDGQSEHKLKPTLSKPPTTKQQQNKMPRLRHRRAWLRRRRLRRRNRRVRRNRKVRRLPRAPLQNSAPPVQPQAGYAMANTSATGAPPMTDSQSANAPNGMRFSGSGTYQWYRQGNLTWRTDTASGRSCIVYATLEEWRKQIVLSPRLRANDLARRISEQQARPSLEAGFVFAHKAARWLRTTKIDT